MIVVALILVVVCAVVILGAVFGDPSAAVRLNFFDATSVDGTSIEVFLIGLGTGAVSLLALWLFIASLRRAAHKASERRAMEKRHDELEKEKADLEHKLGRDRKDSDLTSADPDRSETYGLKQPPDADPR